MSLAILEPEVEHIEPLARLSRDLKRAAVTLTPAEARYLVDLYYQVQEYRKRAANQNRAMGESGEPHQLIDWVFASMETLENDIKRALDSYSDSRVAGRWAKSIVGIGPVIAAGLLAHIDITKAPTVGHIWRFAGLDSTVEWLGTEKAKALVKDVLAGSKQVSVEHLAAISQHTNRKLENIKAWDSASRTLVADLDAMTPAKLAAGLARRPWNADLKVLCWKAGQSFVKVCNNPKDVYGHLYAQRKLYEWRRNLLGGNAEACTVALQKALGKDTKAYQFYSGSLMPNVYPLDDETATTLATLAMTDTETFNKSLLEVEKGTGVPMLPPAHIQARSERWATKVFLSHLHHVMYEAHYGVPPPKPYILTREGHTHLIAPPGWPM